MKIVRAEAKLIEMPMQEPYTVAYHSADTARNVFLTLETDGMHLGLGVSAPDEEVTGETPASVLRALQEIAVPMLVGEKLSSRRRVLERIGTALDGQPTALAAVDIALWDCVGKQAGMPLYKMLGGYRDRILTSITIGILPEPETVQRAKDWIQIGYRCLKIKGGHDWQLDVARVRRVRETVGAEIGIRFDANQGYGFEECTNFLRETTGVGLEFIEQPTPKEDPALLKRVTALELCPTMADEMVKNLSEALKLREEKVANLWNIKLMKTGGITGALPIAEVARSSGVQTMVGCMDEATLGIAAGLHFALSSPGVQYADLDGNVGLIGDPSAGAVIMEGGYLCVNGEPGLGVKG